MADAEQHTTSSTSSAPSGSSWTTQQPLNAYQALLHPLANSALPEPKENEALFLPKTPEHLWYLGFLQEWQGFNTEVIDFFNSPPAHRTFDAMGKQPMGPPRATDVGITSNNHGHEVLTSWFRRHVLEVVIDVMNRFMFNLGNEESIQGMCPGNPTEEDLGNNERVFNPTFVIKAIHPKGDDPQTRMLGQVEYLGGKPGALTWSIDEAAGSTWGSIRCVLGDIVHSMFMSSTRYAFLVSADEIIFLKSRMEQTEHYVVPWIEYSAPIKMADVLDEEKGTIPVKLALNYMMCLSMLKLWEDTETTGAPMRFFAQVETGNGYAPEIGF